MPVCCYCCQVLLHIGKAQAPSAAAACMQGGSPQTQAFSCTSVDSNGVVGLTAYSVSCKPAQRMAQAAMP
jgi:hypothetical protein